MQDGEYILKYEPDANVMYDTQQSIDFVQALRVVDEVIVYENVDEVVQRVDFDIFAIGGEQVHAGFQRVVNGVKNMEKRLCKTIQKYFYLKYLWWFTIMVLFLCFYHDVIWALL